MNQALEKANHLYHAVEAAEDRFGQIVAHNPSVDWASESMFAYQMITANSFTMKVAQENRESVKNAVINVAAVGLSLNPATQYAYLVPRGGAICLDISYKGLIKIATDSGSIKWAKAELVYQGDEFEYLGPAEKPIHKQNNPFSSRYGTPEEFIGVYCIAKTNDGDFLIEKMSRDEIMKIKEEASKAAKGPWLSYFGEMSKKCVIKRASKTWPKTDQYERLNTAVNVINETEGSEWAEESHRFEPGQKVEIVERMRGYLEKGDEFGVIEEVEAWTQGDPEAAMKFWALFSPVERSCIKAMTDSAVVENDRIKSGRPDLNADIETPEL